MTPLWKLCEDGNLDGVRGSLARGVNINRANGAGRSGLMLAVYVYDQHNSTVRLLLEHPTVDLNFTVTFDQTALHWAVNGIIVEGVRLLLADCQLNSANHPSAISFFWIHTIFCDLI